MWQLGGRQLDLFGGKVDERRFFEGNGFLEGGFWEKMMGLLKP